MQMLWIMRKLLMARMIRAGNWGRAADMERLRHDD